SRITAKAERALIWFFALIAAYISLQLEWKMAVGALVAVAHDIVLSVGVYSLFQFEVTPATVIAFLTIMGYSLYDTIVVYDRARELSGRLTATGRFTYTEMMNQSLNQVLMRSINTSVTSILPVASMLIIGSFFLGALTLQEFAIALLVGLVVGTYSSLFVAAPVVAYLKEREPAYREIARRAARRAGDDTPAAARRAAGVAAARPVARTAPGGGVPRPRKKRKR
ncbi:MAG: protein translocase subunit SecF, partial [Actinomyces sp.]